MKNILYILIFIASIGHSQEINLSKKSISRIFLQNERGTTHGFKKKDRDSLGARIYSSYDNWYSLKSVDSLNKNDTILIYNNSKYRDLYYGSEIFIWNMYKDKAVNFHSVIGNSGKVTRDWFDLTIIDDNQGVKMELRQNEKIIVLKAVKLELIYFDKSTHQPTYVLTLKKTK
jgi:hypothetical protein